METKILDKTILDLIHELEGKQVDLIIGGGYGILHRIEERRKKQDRTLYSAWPYGRTTGDIDLYLRADLLINSEKLIPLREALDNLDFIPVEKAKYYQFYKTDIEGLPEDAVLKLDILTGPPSFFHGT